MPLCCRCNGFEEDAQGCRVNNFLINFGIQHWNTEYNWWHPNTVPLDFVLGGVRRAPATHLYHWFDISNRALDHTYTEEELLKFDAMKTDFLHNYKNVKYFSVNDVDKYIFPVFIRTLNYFNTHENVGFKFVGDKVLKDVKDSKAKIVLMFPLEGTSGQLEFFNRDFEILNKWCVDAGLTKDQVYFIHGNFKIPDNIDEYNFKYIPVHSFYCWIKTKLDYTIPYRPTSNKNLFLSYNRRWDYHRMMFVCEVIKNDLDSRGLISYSGKAVASLNATQEELMRNHNRDDLNAAAKKLDALIPLELDLPLDVQTSACVNEIIEEHYRETFLSVITETLWRAGTIFFSEKTWKPILAGQPFMYVASAGTLAELRKQGYKTFSNWWDESYDAEENIDKRISMVVDELVKLSKLSQTELIAIREEMAVILEHNQKLFLHYRDNVYHNGTEEQLYQQIKQIWNEF